MSVKEKTSIYSLKFHFARNHITESALDGKKMKQPIKSNEHSEKVVEPFIAALKTEKLANACRILFINGDALRLSALLEQIGLVTVHGPSEGNSDGADLVAEQAKLKLISLGKEIMPQMLNVFGESIVSASVEVASIEKEEERQSMLTMRIMEKAKSEEFKEFYEQMFRYAGGAIKPLSELMIGSLYKFLLERYKEQSQIVPQFNDVVASLRKLGLATPFLSLALCPSCNNYEFTFSRSARFQIDCPKCGSIWSIIIVHELLPEFASLKMKNQDLAAFISSYLKSKLPYPVQVQPNAEFKTKNGKIEVDVYIPDLETGIECKNYVNTMVVTNSTIKSESGKLRIQIENYLSLGIKKVVVVTNFNEDNTNKLGNSLKKLSAGMKGLEEIQVLGSDLIALTLFLDKMCQQIENTVNKRIQQGFDNRIKKQIKKGK